jgi:AcrR family transcriptional regulator
MPASRKPNPAARPRPRRTRAQTRERLLAAALELLHHGGEAAVTSVSVTRATGIAQSAFYRHFANVEECLAAAAERAVDEIRTAVASDRRRMFESGPGTGDDVERSLRAMFAMADRQRPIQQLFLRHRSDPRALNGVMYRFERGLVRDLAEQLTGRAAKAGVREPPAEAVEALADYLVGACLSAIAAFLDGRGPGADQSARLLAAFATGACRAVYEVLHARK